MLLCEDGHTGYVIVLPVDAFPAERYAARELSHFLGRVSGAEFAVVGDRFPKTGPEIVLGHGPRAAALGVLPAETPGGEEFVVRTAGNDLVIAGGRPRGTLYGIYAFLEEVLGIRFFAPGCTKVPKNGRISLDAGLNLHRKPAFEYRETNYFHMLNGDFAARSRQNGAISRLMPEHGGKMSYVPGYYVHTFRCMIPYTEYYEKHPEYFALKDGERSRGEHAQLCLTHPDVLRICIEKALAALRSTPDASIISISQNDGMFPCQCDGCRNIAEEEGSESGPILRFVNRVAEAVEAEFPHIVVDTLAYDYSRKPPRHVRPRHNVQIRLCTFECCFSHPLENCPEIADTKKAGTPAFFADFAGDVAAWGRLTDRIAIWDYVVDFEFYNLIHPNFQVLGPNMRFFARSGVRSMFCESQGQGDGGEMAELRAYLLAKLMWNPEFDVESGTKEFLDAWFGPAASVMQSYLELFRNALLESGYHLSLFDCPNAPFITPELLCRADALFTEAERLVGTLQPELRRIRKEYLAVRLARFFHTPADLPGREEQVERFMRDAAALGVTRFSAKWGRENMRRLLRRGVWPPHPDDMEIIPD